VRRWVNGKQDGRGTYTTSDGKVREGEWKDGKRYVGSMKTLRFSFP